MEKCNNPYSRCQWCKKEGEMLQYFCSCDCLEIARKIVLRIINLCPEATDEQQKYWEAFIKDREAFHPVVMPQRPEPKPIKS